VNDRLEHLAWRLTGFSFIRQNYSSDHWSISFSGPAQYDPELGEWVNSRWPAPVSLSHQIWPSGSGHHVVHLNLWKLSIEWGRTWGKTGRANENG